ncbi:MAG: hypothetical protein HYS13_15600 [Planctomycetia bacterium]|nr:hypothetical protein [Planctomycetia bacterium]
MNVRLIWRVAISAVAPMFAAAAIALTAGCQREEKILDIETPAGEVEVQRTRDADGTPKVKVEQKDRDVEIDIEKRK